MYLAQLSLVDFRSYASVELPLEAGVVAIPIATKLAEDDPLSARSINMTLTLMAAILEGAVERERFQSQLEMLVQELEQKQVQ